MTEDKLLIRVAKLLRQAEGASTEEEADAFLQKAQQISTIHSIDLAIARAHQAKSEKRQSPVQRTIMIGTRGKRGLKYYVQLFLQIAAANDLTCNIAHNSTYVIAFGFEDDIAVAEALYLSLVTQMVEASNKFLRSGEYKSETTFVNKYAYEEDYYGKRERYYVGMTEKPVDGRVARASFQAAFATRIGQRLMEARDAAEAVAIGIKTTEDEVTPDHVASGTELVLIEKRVELADFYKEKSRARGSWGGYKSSGRYSSMGSNAGRQAGSAAHLGGERAITSGQSQIGGGR